METQTALGAHHCGWHGIMAGSLGLWFLAQFGISEWLYVAMVGPATMHLPFNETGAFSTLAWQFLWVLGLWMGASRGDAPKTAQSGWPA